MAMQGGWVATGRLFVYFIFPATFKNNNQPVHILSAGTCYLFYFIFYFSLQHAKITINLCKCPRCCPSWMWPGHEYWVAQVFFKFYSCVSFWAFFPFVVVFDEEKQNNNSCVCLMGCTGSMG